MRKICRVLCIMTLPVLNATAQDIHFSQIHSSPNQINPALTGLFNGDIRFIGNYKNQWKTVTADYNTYFASLDGKILFTNNKDFVSAGIKAYSDNAGDLNFSKKEASVSLSITKSLGTSFENYFSLGTEVGWLSQSIEMSQVHMLDNEYDPGITSLNSQNALDLSFGVNWYFKTRKLLYYVGGSLYHFNNPELGSNTNSGNEKLYKKYVINSGAEIKVSNRLTIMPSLLCFYQGPHQEVNIGSYVRHKLNTDEFSGRKFFYYGMWFRWYQSFQYNSGYDAVIASVRLDYKSLSYTFSYDFTVSSLTTSSGKLTGSPEVSIIYLMDDKIAMHLSGKHANKAINCPEF